MEEALQPFEADQAIKPNNYLVLGIAASVVLHLACTAVLLSLPQGSPGTPHSITYVDLNAVQQPAPMAVPPPKAAPQEVVPVPETPQVPETVPPPQATETLTQQPPAAPQVTRVEEQRSQTTIGLGLTKGYFKSLGDGETLREDVKEYYLAMLQQINEKWWMDQQVDKRNLSPVVVILTVARSGEIIGSEILRGSGNPRYDRAVLVSLTAANPLPPLPDNYNGETFQAPIRLVPPLNLMAW